MTSELFANDPVLLHNPRCSKSRSAKALLEERGVTFREHRYLEEPLSRPQLEELARRLGRPAREWVRRGEEAYKQARLDASSTDATILDAMARYPVLIERPILIKSKRAVVGRPPEKILDLLD